jgi:protein-disulfide isomerase
VRSFGLLRLLAFPLIGFAVLAVSAVAQTSIPPGHVGPFTDTSMLKPPPGVKLAVIEWEDLECPMCAHAFPFVHAAVAQYHIPLIEYDFVIPGHAWSHQAALYARYVKDKLSPDLATDYRRQVFAAQYRIATPEDLVAFTKQFFAQHGKQMPFVVDPAGQFEREIRAESQLRMKLGASWYTPTIVVVTPNRWIEVKDVSQLDAAIEQAKTWANEAGPAGAHRTATAAHTH